MGNRTARAWAAVWLSLALAVTLVSPALGDEGPPTTSTTTTTSSTTTSSTTTSTTTTTVPASSTTTTTAPQASSTTTTTSPAPATTTTTAPKAAIDDPEEPDEDDVSVTTTTAPPGQARSFTPVKRYDVLRKLVFPVVGVAKFYDGFGGCRDNCTREHHGVDITTFGWKGLPVVAAHDGTVVKVTYDEGNPGCSVRIRGRGGWETRYYHLNNDVPGTDEIGAPCPAPGIEVGTKVVAGQIIGYLGDSGNSETTIPHLHFELRTRSGYPVDPYRSLRQAARITYEWLPTDPQAATVAVSRATHETATLAVLVPSDEFLRLGMSEHASMILQSPVLAVDRSDPAPALIELDRLAPERILVVSDSDERWIEGLVRSRVPLIASAPLPPSGPDPDIHLPYDAREPIEWSPVDRFTTLVVGVVDRIYRSRTAAYEDYTKHHRSIVLTHDRWASTRVGVRSWSSPGRNAEERSLWWRTGDGWVATETLEAAPEPGIAYVTERLAQPQTLTFLGDLAELPPYPIWKASD